MSSIKQALLHRPRRLRQHARIRQLVQEHRYHASDFIMPMFVCCGQQVCQPIASMPEQYQYSLDMLPEVAKKWADAGLQSVILFGVVDDKDATGSVACRPDGLIQQAIQVLRAACPHWLIIADVCFCQYTDHGHCGVLDATGQLDNDASLAHLAAQAVSLAQAGADVLAPSGMLDGMVATMRHALDAHGFEQCPILSYAVKYASCLYGPFRDAANGAPQQGDRHGYQMQVANGAEALLEAELDVQQGADMLMVKPAYGDILYRLRQQYPHLPIGAYHVSGQYAMMKASVEKGWLDERHAVEEMVLSFKRAGASFIITYYAVWITKHLCVSTAAVSGYENQS